MMRALRPLTARSKKRVIPGSRDGDHTLSVVDGDDDNTKKQLDCASSHVLFKAMDAGDQTTVKRILDEPNFMSNKSNHGHYGETVLHYCLIFCFNELTEAARLKAKVEAVRWLLKTWEDAHPGNRDFVNATYKTADDADDDKYNGETALHVAVVQKADSVVRLLVKYGADLHASASGSFFRHPKYYGSVPLNFAVSTHQLSMVKLLLELGADPRFQDEAMQMNALHMAAFHRCSDIYRYLAMLTQLEWDLLRTQEGVFEQAQSSAKSVVQAWTGDDEQIAAGLQAKLDEKKTVRVCSLNVANSSCMTPLMIAAAAAGRAATKDVEGSACTRIFDTAMLCEREIEWKFGNIECATFNTQRLEAALDVMVMHKAWLLLDLATIRRFYKAKWVKVRFIFKVKFAWTCVYALVYTRVIQYEHDHAVRNGACPACRYPAATASGLVLAMRVFVMMHVVTWLILELKVMRNAWQKTSARKSRRQECGTGESATRGRRLTLSTESTLVKPWPQRSKVRRLQSFVNVLGFYQAVGVLHHVLTLCLGLTWCADTGLASSHAYLQLTRAMGSLTLYLYMLFFATGTKRLGPIIAMCLRMLFVDVLKWMGLYLVVLISFSRALSLALNLPGKGWGSCTAMLYQFSLGINVDDTYQLVHDEGHSKWLATNLVLLYAGLVVVVLLNMLIALMSSTYSQMAARSRILHRSGRVCLVRYLEAVGEVFSNGTHTMFGTKQQSYAVGSEGKWHVEDLRRKDGLLDTSHWATGISFNNLD
jgi:ankyrin repeat protein